MGAVLSFLAGAIAFQSDAGEDIRHLGGEVADKPVATALLLIAIGLMGFIWRNEIIGFFGGRQTAIIKTRLQKWALRNGYTIKDVGRPPAEQEFQFLIRDAQERPISVVKPTNDDCLRLAVGIKVEPKLVTFLADAGVFGIEAVVHLRLAMAGRGIRYTGLAVPANLDEVQLSIRLPLNLSEYQFIENVQMMTNVIVVFQQTLAAEQMRIAILKNLATNVPQPSAFQEPLMPRKPKKPQEMTTEEIAKKLFPKKVRDWVKKEVGSDSERPIKDKDKP